MNLLFLSTPHVWLDTRGEVETGANQDHLASNCRRGVQDPPSHLGDCSEADPEQTGVGTFITALPAASRHGIGMSEWVTVASLLTLMFQLLSITPSSCWSACRYSLSCKWQPGSHQVLKISLLEGIVVGLSHFLLTGVVPEQPLGNVIFL